METTREREDLTTTRVLPATENEGPKETNGMTDETTTGQIITELADKAIIEADIQISELVSPACDALFYPGTTTDEIIESLYKIKTILDTIKRESRRL